MGYFHLFVSFWAILLILGCDDSDKESETKASDADVSCGKSTKEPLDPDQSTSVGTPEEFVQWINGEQRIPVSWWAYETGSESATFIDTTLITRVETNVNEAYWVTYPSSTNKSCSDRLELTGVLAFETTDKVFKEHFDITTYKTVDDPSRAQIESVIQIDQFVGQYDFEPLMTKYNKPTVYFQATALPQLSNGKLEVSHKYRTQTSSTTIMSF